MKPFLWCEYPARAIAGRMDGEGPEAETLGYATLTVPDHLTGLVAPMPALISAA